MRVHEYVEAILLGLAQHVDGVLYPGLVVLARPGGLDRLPSKDISDGVVTVALQSGEVNMCVFLAKRTAVEFDIVAIEEVVGDMRGNIGGTWQLCIARHVYAAKKHMPAIVVSELTIFNGQSKSRHNRRSDMCMATTGNCAVLSERVVVLS